MVVNVEERSEKQWRKEKEAAGSAGRTWLEKMVVSARGI